MTVRAGLRSEDPSRIGRYSVMALAEVPQGCSGGEQV